jgi:hypothetical protein
MVELSPLDLGLCCGTLVEQIRVVNRHQQIALFHALAGFDMDAPDFSADLGFHIHLQRRLHLASKGKDG